MKGPWPSWASRERLSAVLSPAGAEPQPSTSETRTPATDPSQPPQSRTQATPGTTEPEESPMLCHCGCGQPAPIAKKTSTAKGVRAGQQLRYVLGHGPTNGHGKTHHHRRDRAGQPPGDAR